MVLSYVVKFSRYASVSSSDLSSPCVANWHVLHDVTMPDDVKGRCYQLADASLTMEVRDAGEMTFTVPCTHAFHDELSAAGICFVIGVWRNGEFLWGGHPMTMDEDMYGNITYTCEGALGFLADVYDYTYYNVPTGDVTDGQGTGLKFAKDVPSIAEWYDYFMQYATIGQMAMMTESYNSETTIGLEAYHTRFYGCDYSATMHVPRGSATREYTDDDETTNSSASFVNANQKINIETTYVTRYSGKYLTTLDNLHKKLTDYFGGTLRVTLTEDESYTTSTRQRGIWYLHWEDNEQDVSQVLEVGKNVLSRTRSIDYSDFCTAYVPVDSEGNRPWNDGFSDEDGKTPAVSDRYNNRDAEEPKMPRSTNSTWQRTTVEKAKWACMFVNIELAKQYGIICKTYEIDDEYVGVSWNYLLDNDNSIYAAAAALSAPSATIEVQCVDLALLGDSSDPLHVGARVQYVDKVRGETAEMIVEEMTVNLGDPSQNTLTLGGTLKKISGMI